MTHLPTFCAEADVDIKTLDHYQKTQIVMARKHKMNFVYLDREIELNNDNLKYNPFIDMVEYQFQKIYDFMIPLSIKLVPTDTTKIFIKSIELILNKIGIHKDGINSITSFIPELNLNFSLNYGPSALYSHDQGGVCFMINY